MTSVAIANDFNSELTVILNGVALALAHLEPGHPARTPLWEAQSAGQRAAELCHAVQQVNARAGIGPARGSMAAVLGI